MVTANNHGIRVQMTVKGLAVRSISKTSAAYKIGLRPGDRILSVNNEPVGHELDFLYSTAADHLDFAVARGNRCSHLEMDRPVRGFTGVEFADQKLKRCANRCIFCFVDQMPPRMRRTLYIKDEDYRHSFLYGNYMTLSCLSKNDTGNIIRMGLSPIYVSVHVTDPGIRNRMMRNAKAPPVLDQLRHFQENNISFHTQIVVCPGHNDGAVLDRSIADLLGIGKGLLSVAVVPVGLTRYHRNGLSLPGTPEARAICSRVDAAGDADKKKSGHRRIFLADEFYIKAGIPIPARTYYEEFPQIENGVGLVRTLLDESRKAIQGISTGKPSRLKPAVVMTSASAGPVLAQIINKINRKLGSVTLATVVVPNRTFGESVTVAGLLTAQDVIHSIRGIKPAPQMAVVPGIMFNHNGVTLDGYSMERIERMCRIPVVAVSTVTELLKKTGIIR